jgi:hypothetical protein
MRDPVILPIQTNISKIDGNRNGILENLGLATLGKIFGTILPWAATSGDLQFCLL